MYQSKTIIQQDAWCVLQITDDNNGQGKYGVYEAGCAENRYGKLNT